ncbi:thiol protease SEN102-like isoform X2 [Papaver somniferum]|nr:thiol protease SEN102-like isoform X2 [Papaver somniferum]
MTVRSCATTTSSNTQPRGFVVKYEDMESEESMMSLYERWMEHYQICRNGEEKNRRFQVFQDCVRRFRSAFADMSDAEFSKRLIKRWDFVTSRARLPAPKNE